jgi:hypothetical protein
MKQGRSLTDLAAEIERQHKTKVDYLVPSDKLNMKPNAEIQISGQANVQPNSLAHQQIGDKLGIPKAYYDRMLEEDQPLLASNVNTWLAKQNQKVHLVRTLDGKLLDLTDSGWNEIESEKMPKVLVAAWEVGRQTQRWLKI